MARILILLLVFFIPIGSFAKEELAYHSDYFSFVGRDANGFVMFALDNNRGVDGANFQAEHFGVLYDQQSGWVKLVGTGDYENIQGLLMRIPDSPHFNFEGRPETGFNIRSKGNRLMLKIGPLITQLSESKEKRIVSWSVAEATLSWKDREIPGRVIHEQLVHMGWNRLTRKYSGTWDNFQGFYLALDSGSPDAWQDLYLRSEGDGKNRRTKGFATIDKWSGAIHSNRFEAYEKALNFGFFRWPQRWAIEVKLNDSSNTSTGQLMLRQVSRENQGNWIVGGFAMTVVAGELVINQKRIPVLGFGELIK